MRVRIALDALGGEHGPSTVVTGGVQACREYAVEVVLVGTGALISRELAMHDTRDLALSIVEANESVGFEESPTTAFRLKKNSSIAVGMDLLKKNEVSAFVSAGNTGALMTAALLTLGRQKGIKTHRGCVPFTRGGPGREPE